MSTGTVTSSGSRTSTATTAAQTQTQTHTQTHSAPRGEPRSSEVPLAPGDRFDAARRAGVVSLGDVYPAAGPVLAAVSDRHGADSGSVVGPHFHKLHSVARDETLWGLSQRYYPDLEPNVAVQKLAQANAIEDPSLIRVGQSLVIPDRTEYVANLGETLASVAERFGTDVELLALLNNIGLDHEVSTYPVDGKRLVVPVAAIPVDDAAEPLDADHEGHTEPLDADHEVHTEPLDADHEGVSVR